jgi:hypothetical protein
LAYLEAHAPRVACRDHQPDRSTTTEAHPDPADQRAALPRLSRRSAAQRDLPRPDRTRAHAARRLAEMGATIATARVRQSREDDHHSVRWSISQVQNSSSQILRPAPPRFFSAPKPSAWAWEVPLQARPADLAASDRDVVVRPPAIGGHDRGARAEQRGRGPRDDRRRSCSTAILPVNAPQVRQLSFSRQRVSAMWSLPARWSARTSSWSGGSSASAVLIRI